MAATTGSASASALPNYIPMSSPTSLPPIPTGYNGPHAITTDGGRTSDINLDNMKAFNAIGFKNWTFAACATVQPKPGARKAMYPFYVPCQDVNTNTWSWVQPVITTGVVEIPFDVRTTVKDDDGNDKALAQLKVATKLYGSEGEHNATVYTFMANLDMLFEAWFREYKPQQANGQQFALSKYKSMDMYGVHFASENQETGEKRDPLTYVNQWANSNYPNTFVNDTSGQPVAFPDVVKAFSRGNKVVMTIRATSSVHPAHCGISWMVVYCLITEFAQPSAPQRPVSDFYAQFAGIPTAGIPTEGPIGDRTAAAATGFDAFPAPAPPKNDGFPGFQDPAAFTASTGMPPAF